MDFSKLINDFVEGGIFRAKQKVRKILEPYLNEIYDK